MKHTWGDNVDRIYFINDRMLMIPDNYDSHCYLFSKGYEFEYSCIILIEGSYPFPEEYNTFKPISKEEAYKIIPHNILLV